MMLLWYLIIGFVAICGTILVHLIRAEGKGYDACEWWLKNNTLAMMNRNTVIILFVLGMLIWPIRIMQFLREVPGYYEVYPIKEKS